jgi:hypothetical protein
MADTRTCIGSAKFGITAHEAPLTDFPLQPSQRDGLGRMCRPHWTAYTRALRRASAEPKAAPASVAEVDRAKADKAAGRAAQQALRAKASPAKAPKPEPIKTKPARKSKAEVSAN